MPSELEQFLISTDTHHDAEEKIKWVSTNNETDNKKYTTEYYSQAGELLKAEHYVNGTKKEIYYNNGNVINKDEFNVDRIYEIKSFDKNRKLISSTKYIRINGFVISIVRHENGNEYKISYSYDEIKRIINKTIYINQEIIIKQIYCYDSLNRIAEYRDNQQTLNIINHTTSNIPAFYTLSDIYGNQIDIKNNFDNYEYKNTEITLNSNSKTIINEYYYNNFILKKPSATEEDFNCTISHINKWFNMENSKSGSILQFENKNKILPITLRKRALVI